MTRDADGRHHRLERERRKVVIQIVVRRSVVQDIVEQTETRPADVVGLQCW